MSLPDVGLPGRIAVALEGAGLEGLVSAYLFGSHAAGRPHAESDVDVGILLDRRIHPTARHRFDAGILVSSRLQASLRTPRIDLVILNDTPPGLGRAVVTSGQRLLCRDPGVDHAFVRDVQLRAGDLEPFLRRARRVKLEALAR